MVSKKLSKHQGSLFTWPIIITFMALFLITVIMLWRQSKQSGDGFVSKDIQQLQQIFEQIHKDCYIADFEHATNYIDFLNVVSFTGSIVGSMNLGFAKNWHGPYLKANPRAQGRLYMILKNKQGYFIVPGDGVVLGNGKIIGKDIILDHESDMHSLMQSSDGLLSPAGVLATPVKIGSKSMNNLLLYPETFSILD